MQSGFEHCPYCNSDKGYIYAHGHYQCKVCKSNVISCLDAMHQDRGHMEWAAADNRSWFYSHAFMFQIPNDLIID